MFIVYHLSSLLTKTLFVFLAAGQKRTFYLSTDKKERGLNNAFRSNGQKKSVFSPLLVRVHHQHVYVYGL
jgi:hypothetical protein